jgi:outer membrane protein OmpA-like peptidoglycan-associated protein/tetratricopeptide (TPR) repeat protein
MIKQKVILALLLCIIASSSAFAQFSKVKRARMYMEELNYMGAIELYNQILDKDDNPEAKINIAEAYRKVNDSENAEYWYGQVVQLADSEPIHKLYYGQMLQRNGKCDLAKEWYQAYVDAVPEDQRGQYLVQACDYEDELRTKNAGIYEIVHVDFNSNLDDFSPAYYDDGLVFASERDKGIAIVRTTEWTGNPFNELFQVKRQKEGKEPAEYTYKKPEKYSKKLNSKFHDAAVTYNKDQSKIYFTRNNIMNGKVGKDDDGIIRLKVFSATISGDEWKDLEGLPFNSDEYSVAHPTLNAEGTKMYFSSDMPGGFGGMDLYMTTMDGSSWGPPINLGARINTEGSEIFPYYDSNSERLYFGSNGHVGLGGLDIYYMDDKGEDQFGDVINMGYPLNTISDDFGIIFDEEGKEGYFTSDREGGVGRDDIYAFRKSAAAMEILVIDEATGEPIPGATVTNDCTGAEMLTNTEGKIMFDMKMDQCCNFAASMDEYLDNSKEGCTKSVEMGQKVFVEIPLKKEVLFNLDVLVVDPTTGIPIEGAMLTLTNDCEGVEPEVLYTDSTGMLSYELAENCCYTVTAKKDGYFGSPVENQCTRDLTEPTTLQAIVNLSPIVAPEVTDEPIVGNNPPTMPEGYTTDSETGQLIDKFGEPVDGPLGQDYYEDGIRQPREGEFPIVEGVETQEGQPIAYLLHIYYDFDQSYLRDEAQPEIDKLCRMLTENSDLIIEIASHTDSRGSFRYNRSLSQRRAESVVRALVDCGISEQRLVARGYGENQNINNCANRIPCSEREHQMNRRTEFRVIGCMSCADVKAISKQNDNTKVDECASCPF